VSMVPVPAVPVNGCDVAITTSSTDGQERTLAFHSAKTWANIHILTGRDV